MVSKKITRKVSIKKKEEPKQVKNGDELKDKVRNYILSQYEQFGYAKALTITQSYMKESNKAQRNLNVKGLAPTIRGELSEIFLEVYLREYVRNHKDTFYVKGLCIPRLDGKEGYTEIDLILFTKYKVFLFECKSYSGKKRLIDEGTMVTEMFKPFSVFKQNRMHLDNLRRYLDSARLTSISKSGVKPYSISMFSFNTDDILDLRTVEWKEKFPLNTEKTINKWLNNYVKEDKTVIWDIKKLFKIVKTLQKSSDENFKKHLKISKERSKKLGGI